MNEWTLYQIFDADYLDAMHLMEDVLGRLWVDYIFWESLLAPVREVPLLLQPTFHTFAVRNFRLPVGCFFLGLATIVNPLDGPFFFERGHELLGAGFSPIEAVDYVRENQHLLSISMYDRGTGTIVTLYGDFDYGLCWVPHTGDGTGEPHWLPYTGLVPSSDTSSGSSLPGSEAFWHSDSSDSGFSYPSIFGGSVAADDFSSRSDSLEGLLFGSFTSSQRAFIDAYDRDLPAAPRSPRIKRYHVFASVPRREVAFASAYALRGVFEYVDCFGSVPPPVDATSALTIWDNPLGLHCPQTIHPPWWYGSITAWFGRRAVYAGPDACGVEMRMGDHFYALSSPAVLGPTYLQRLSSVEIDGIWHDLGPIFTVATVDSRIYELREVLEPRYCCDVVEDISSFCRLRYPVLKFALEAEAGGDPDVKVLGCLPARTRAQCAWALTRGYVPDDLVPAVQLARQGVLAEEDCEAYDPVEVVSALSRYDRALSRTDLVKKAFAFPGRHPRSCVNCGGPTPTVRYRWKKRVCGACQRLLATTRSSTGAAAAIQAGYQVPTCYPGLVQRLNAEYDPPLDKLSEVKLRPGQVQVRKFADGGQGVGEWVDVTVSDLQLYKQRLERYPITLAGIGISGAYPTVSSPSSFNQLKAVLCRVFRRPPSVTGPRAGYWAKATALRGKILPELEGEPMSFEAWLATMPSQRKKALLRAYRDLKWHGWRTADEWFKAFVKTEALADFDQGEELSQRTTMVDRLIQGPSDKAHCIAGPIIKPLVESLKRAWGPSDPIFYASATPDKLHTFLQRLVGDGRQYFWCDFSMFDCTHSSDSWDFVEGFYKTADPLFWEVMKAWRRPKGRIGRFRYYADVMNASGRDDTSLANALLNGFATYLAIAAAYFGKTVLEVTELDLWRLDQVLVLGVAGDDSVWSLPQASVPSTFCAAVEDAMRGFGFVPKMGTSTLAEDAVFLGHRPVRVGPDYFWLRTLGRALYKFGWVVTPDYNPMQKDFMSHITGVADMHCRVSSSTPVLYEMARKIVDLRKGAKRIPVRVEECSFYNFTLPGVAYDIQTLWSLSRAYSKNGVVVTPRDFIGLISDVASIEALPCVIDHWLLRHMVNVDEV
jgi:hypothetical protein